MTTLSEKKVEWLYDHFQAVSRISDRILVLIAILFVSAMAVFQSMTPKVELPFLKVDVGREILLGCLLLSIGFLFVAFFGNYDVGEKALDALESELECDRAEIWFIDTHPTLIDFARHRREQRERERGLAARAASALLYALTLMLALFWVTGLLLFELWRSSMTVLDFLPFFLALPMFWVAWDRGLEYWLRRWRTFWQSESLRQANAPKAAA
jgi:hypothetical protein